MIKDSWTPRLSMNISFKSGQIRFSISGSRRHGISRCDGGLLSPQKAWPTRYARTKRIQDGWEISKILNSSRSFEEQNFQRIPNLSKTFPNTFRNSGNLFPNLGRFPRDLHDERQGTDEDGRPRPQSSPRPRPERTQGISYNILNLEYN